MFLLLQILGTCAGVSLCSTVKMDQPITLPKHIIYTKTNNLNLMKLIIRNYLVKNNRQKCNNNRTQKLL